MFIYFSPIENPFENTKTCFQSNFLPLNVPRDFSSHSKLSRSSHKLPKILHKQFFQQNVIPPPHVNLLLPSNFNHPIKFTFLNHFSDLFSSQIERNCKIS